MEKKSEISIILKEICQIANLLFQETNTELEVTSTDKSVISVEKAKGINIKLVANKAGTSTVTVRPKYNPESAKTYKITVYDPLQINKFEADTNDPKIGEKVNQTATINGITYKVTKVVNTKNAQVMIKSLNKKKSSIVIPDYVTVKRVKCKVVSINKKAVIKVPKKQYNKYKKSFTSKTGFKKPMKLKK